MTATEKWSDQWFRKLSPTLKLGYLYLLDACDCAGVIELDRELANFQIGIEVDWEGLLKASEGRVQGLGNGRYWLTKFVGFQYGEILSETCNAHKAVVKSLRKYGLFEGSMNPSGTLPGRDQDKDKDKDKDKGGCGGKKFQPPTVDQVAEYCQERGNGIDPEAFVAHYEANGWRRGNNRIKDWKACVRTWEAKRKEERAIQDTEANPYR